MNVFMEKIRKGKITDGKGLKRYFWKVVRQVHPDTSSLERSNELFIKIRNDYEAAQSYLTAGIKETPAPTVKAVYDRDFFYMQFSELVASNFPLDESVKEKNSLYRKRMRALSESFCLQDGMTEGLMEKVEAELNVIRGESVVDNKLFGSIKLFMYTVCSFHFSGNALYSYSLKKIFDQISTQLDPAQNRYTLMLFEWLLRDLAKGRIGG